MNQNQRLFGRPVYVKPRPRCPRHGEWRMVQRNGSWHCMASTQKEYAWGWGTEWCDFVSSERVRLERVEPYEGDFESERESHFEVDRESP